MSLVQLKLSQPRGIQKRFLICGLLVYAVLVLVSNAFAAPPPPPATAPPPGASVVVALAGTAEYLLAGTGNWLPAKPGQMLRLGDAFRTAANSRAAIRLATQTVVTVDQNTSFTNAAPAQPDGPPILRLLKGVTSFFSRDLPSEIQFRSRTVSGATRGTEFLVAVDDAGATTVSVLEGSVDLTALTTSAGVLGVDAGFAGRAEDGKPPSRSALIETKQLIQWILYYPMILDPDELEFSAADRAALAASLEAYRLGNPMRALAAYPADRQPASADEKIYRAALSFNAGQIAEAERELQSVRSGNAPNPRLERLAAALRLAVAAVRGDERPAAATAAPGNTNQSASELIAESYYLQSRSDLEGSLASARAATGLAPGFGAAWVRLAEMEFSFGRAEESGRALDRGLQTSPENAQAAALKGFVLAARSQTREAIEQFNRAIELDAMLANGWLGRGLCKIRLGDGAGGREDLLIAAAREPSRAVLRSYLGKAFAETRDLPRAAKELENARRLDPNDPTSWLYSALLNQQRNRINEAVRDLERSQELNQNRGVYRSELLLDQDRAVRSANLASIYRDAGMSHVSLQEAYRAVSHDYMNYSAHLFLANSYNALRDPKQINLRYETPWFSEYLVANLLAPPGAGTLSPTISQHEYSRLLERDRVGVVSTTEYQSSGDWLQSGAQYGIFGNFSYSLDANYRSQNGQRPNNDLELLTLALQFKQYVTPDDGIYFQAIYYDAESGDVRQYYDQSEAVQSLRVNESQEPLLLAGWNHRWSPEHQTLVLLGRMQDDLGVGFARQRAPIRIPNASGQITRYSSFFANLDYYSEFEGFSAEAQHIWQEPRFGMIFGARFQTAQFETAMNQSLSQPAGLPIFNDPVADLRIAPDLERYSAYAYGSWQVVDSLRLTAGLSFDSLDYPINHRSAPIADGEDSVEQVSPKVGFIWNAASNTTFRAAYTRSLGGVSFDQSFQLEPTQVAGFNQSFRSLIPESVSGALAAPEFETAGFAFEQSLATGTYLIAGVDWLNSEVDQIVGIYEAAGFTAIPESRMRAMDFSETAWSVSVGQLVGDSLSFQARYQWSEARMDSTLSELVPSLLPESRTLTEATLHQLTLSGYWNLACGFFAQAHGVWTAQSNRGYGSAMPGDDFWQCHFFAGYRFPRRKAEVSIGLLNATDEDYQLNPLTLYAELPRERTIVATLKLNF